MDNSSIEFNTQLELDVLLNGLTEVTCRYITAHLADFTEVIIPEGVKIIGRCAFSYCNSLRAVTIPDSVTSIEYRAFEHCGGLRNITVPRSVTSIGDNTFEYCKNLSSVTFEGKTMDEVRFMKSYPWGLSPEKIFSRKN